MFETMELHTSTSLSRPVPQDTHTDILCPGQRIPRLSPNTRPRARGDGGHLASEILLSCTYIYKLLRHMCSHTQSLCLAVAASSLQLEDTCLPTQEFFGSYMQEVSDQPLLPWT